MNLDDILFKNGGLIKVNDAIYEVLFVEGDADLVSEDGSYRLYLGIYLHDPKTDSLFPTHMIKYFYDDTKEFFLKLMVISSRTSNFPTVNIETSHFIKDVLS